MGGSRGLDLQATASSIPSQAAVSSALEPQPPAAAIHGKLPTEDDPPSYLSPVAPPSTNLNHDAGKDTHLSHSPTPAHVPSYQRDCPTRHSGVLLLPTTPAAQLGRRGTTPKTETVNVYVLQGSDPHALLSQPSLFPSPIRPSPPPRAASTKARLPQVPRTGAPTSSPASGEAGWRPTSQAPFSEGDSRVCFHR